MFNPYQTILSLYRSVFGHLMPPESFRQLLFIHGFRLILFSALMLSPLLLLSSADATQPGNSLSYSPEDNLLEFEDQQPVFSLKGQYKNQFIYTSSDEASTDSEMPPQSDLLTDVNRLRISPEYRADDNFIIHADIDNEIYAANHIGTRAFEQFWFPSDFNDLYTDSRKVSIGEDLLYRIKLHRLYIKAVTGRFTITAGRQQIRFGSGRLWNPLDILNPISPTFVEGAEDQKGTDALRVEYYPGVATEISFVYAPKRIEDRLDADIFINKNTHAVWRIRTTTGNTDIAALGGRLSQKNIFGMDGASIVHDGMLRASLLYSVPDSGGAYVQASSGFEYTFSNGLYVLIEYFYNQNALSRNPDLLSAFSDSLSSAITEDRYALLANQFLTFNRHYAGIALGFDLTPLLRGDVFVIGDIDGTGLFASPSLTYNLLQDLDISATLLWGTVFKGADYPSDFQDFEEHPLLSVAATWYF